MSVIELFKSVTDTQKKSVKHWWDAFSRDQALIIRSFSDEKFREVFSLPDWMAEHLSPIDDRLMWEYGPALGQGHRLVITPEIYSELRPLVRYMLSCGPVLEGWEFYDYRLPEKVGTSDDFIDSRVGTMDLSQVSFKLAEGKFNTIDVTFALPLRVSKEDSLHKMFLFLEKVLGEELLDKWVGEIDVLDVREAKPSISSFDSINNLPVKFRAVMASLKDRIPTSYIGRGENVSWSLYELEPEEMDDYPGKADIFVYRFISGDLFPATFSYPNHFYSERYARIGEMFIYLKMDGAAGDLSLEVFKDKSDIEDVLEEVLESNKLGTVVGGGTGKRYSYIDMLLCDPEKAFPEILRVLREGKLTKRSWLLFHDADLRREWIGVWDDTVAPPM